jgi:hypothetical protein
MGTLPHHKFTNYVVGNQAYEDLPERDDLDNIFRYLLEVYVDDFVSLVIPTSREQLRPEYMMYSLLMRSTLMIQSPRRNSSNLMGNTPRRKSSSVLILMELRKLFGWKRQNEPTSSRFSAAGGQD